VELIFIPYAGEKNINHLYIYKVCKRLSPTSTFTEKQGDSMQEKVIEQKLTKAVRQNGGVCWKFTSPGTAGVPDRILLMPEGQIAFVEVKAPGETPRSLQLSRHKLLRRLGFRVYVLDNTHDIQKIIAEVKK
jgi:hypothetical protein